MSAPVKKSEITRQKILTAAEAEFSEVEELTETVRGEGGFGSTGKK